MTANRKLQGEIDRLLKKVAEGVAEFDMILSKVHSASSSNQKEKYEADLKKEIKKLQRSRDQIKTWLTSSEVKQKGPLLEARKTIEAKMEQFKNTERDSKTKAFSKEGLQMADKEDDGGKAETRRWIGKSLKALKNQIDQFESEIETIPVRKRNTPRAEHLLESVERHKQHLNKLERVLRSLDNDTVSVEKVKEIRDSVEYYVEHNQDDDFVDDPEVYDGLNLKEEDDRPVLLRSSGADSEDVSDDEEESNLSQNSTTSTGSGGSAGVAIKSAKKFTEALSSPPARVPLSASIPIPTPQIQILNKPKTEPKHDSATPPEGNRWAVARKHTGAPPSLLSSASSPPLSATGVVPTPVSTNQQNAPRTIMRSGMPMPSDAAAVAKQPQSQPQPNIRQDIQFNQFTRNAPQSANIDRTQPPELQKYMQQQYPASGKDAVEEDSKNSETFDSSNQTEAGSLAEFSSATQEKLNNAPTSGPTSLSSSTSSLPSSTSPSPPLPSTLASQPSSSSSSSLPSSASSTPPLMLPAELEQEISMQLNAQMSSSVPALAMLECSNKNIPQVIDSERQKQYSARNPYPTPPYYPHAPAAIFDNPAIFEKFDTDTLFFIFYYQQGTYQQYLAAKELKKQSWRYHKKYLTWFQRHEEPKEITNDYEQGTYVYFDYETGWCQRKKTEFTFEYRFLEDYD